MEENVVFNSEDVSSNKVMGVLAYLGILFLVPLLAAKDSQYAKFHTNQGLVLFLAEIILGFGGGIVATILGFIPILGWILSGLLIFVICVAPVVFAIIGIINACSGEPKKLPVIGNFTLIK